MTKINSDSIADMVFQLTWNSESARHTEMYHASRVNLWRDWLPPLLTERLMGKQIGDQVVLAAKPGELLPAAVPEQLFTIKRKQFDGGHPNHAVAPPRLGRFYPRGLLRGVSGVFRESIVPFRCVGIDNGDLSVDFNHTLAGRDAELTATVGSVKPETVQKGGTSWDWIGMLSDGPGMQARFFGKQTDFFQDRPYEREDETPDDRFYTQPRLVQHVDDTALDVIRSLYGRHLSDGMRVLDLMSSWQSHIPESVGLKQLTGIGLNAREMMENPQLTGYRVHDLNADPRLPFEPETFDAVVCTVSVEYLVNPMAVFQAVGRSLKPEGVFIVTFSNRWFPPKAIRIWKEAHEFERMGIVLEYFMHSHLFGELQTYTFRGLPRPVTDRYFPQYRYADPVYAVWGKKL